MADFSICTSRACRADTPGIVDKCPVCGARVQTSRRIRVLGWLSIACGLFLIGLMGYVTLAMYPSLTNAGVDRSTAAAGPAPPSRRGWRSTCSIW